MSDEDDERFDFSEYDTEAALERIAVLVRFREIIDREFGDFS